MAYNTGRSVNLLYKASPSFTIVRNDYSQDRWIKNRMFAEFVIVLPSVIKYRSSIINNLAAPESRGKFIEQIPATAVLIDFFIIDWPIIIYFNDFHSILPQETCQGQDNTPQIWPLWNLKLLLSPSLHPPLHTLNLVPKSLSKTYCFLRYRCHGYCSETVHGMP